jgi:hypothetical protein
MRSGTNSTLIRLVSREDFKVFCYHKSINSYVHESPSLGPIYIQTNARKLLRGTTYFTSTSMITYHPALDLQSGLFRSGFQLKFCKHFSFSDMLHLPRLSHPPLFDYTKNILSKMQTINLFVIKFSRAIFYFLSLRYNVFLSIQVYSCIFCLSALKDTL